MKTIIWKELRENLKWAVLAMLCLLLAELGTLHQQGGSGGSGYNDLTIGSSGFLLVSVFGCAVAGAAIGALQILPELRRDQWAALLHRPVARRTIFFGKVVAGLLLYFGATIPPLVASIAYAALPGQFAGPFVPGMIFPPASDLFLGMAVYFTALLISLSRGPWYGRRGLLALFVLAVLFFHTVSPWPLVVTGGASLIAMAAACGAMTSNGPLKDRSTPARLASVFLLLVAVETALALILMVLSMLPAANGRSNYTYCQVRLTHEGQVFLEANKEDGSPAVLTHMDGTPVTDERYLGNNSDRALLSDFTNFIQSMKNDLTLQTAYLAEHPRWLGNYVEISNDSGSESAENWYRLVGKNYFVGYDKISRRCVGICDRDGFHPPDATPRPFPEPLQMPPSNYWLPHLYISGAQLYGLEFSERRMTPLFNAGSGKIYDTSGFSPTYSNGKSVYIGVALEKEIQIVDPKGNPVVKFPYGHDSAHWPDVSLATVPAADRIFVEYEPETRGAIARPGLVPQPTFVDEVNLQGKVVRSESTVFPLSVASTGWLEPATVCTLPLAPSAVVVGYYWETQKGVASNVFVTAVWFDNPLICLAALFVISVGLGIGTLCWARRVGLPEATARRWAIFVLCFGLPGLITFRLGADWPVRISCPKCGRKRSIAGEECPQCHQAWPLPEGNGTEIFQPMAN